MGKFIRRLLALMERRKTWVNLLLFLSVLIAVVWYIVKNTGTLNENDLSFRLEFLIPAFLSSMASYLSNMIIWWKLAASFNLRADFASTCRAWALSKLGRYIPGKVALLIIRINLYRGMSRKNVVTATFTEYFASLSASSLVLLIAVFSFSGSLGVHMIWVAIAAFVLFSVILHPRVLGRGINGILKLLKREPIEDYPPYKIILPYVFIYLIPVFFNGLAFYLLLNSLGHVSFKFFVPLTGIYYGAALIGMAAVFSPSGLGVREGIMFLVLPQFLPRDMVIIGAIAIRLLSTASELVLAGIFSWSRI